MLGIFSNREKFKWRSLAKSSQTCTSLRCTGQSSVHHTVSSARLGHPVNKTLSRKTQGAAAIIHQTVRSVVHRTVRCASPALSQRSVARSASATWAWPTVTRPHRTVRCAMGLEVGNGRFRQTRKGIAHCSLSGGASDCPVRPRVEGNQGLPNEGATTPLALGGYIRGP